MMKYGDVWWWCTMVMCGVMCDVVMRGHVWRSVMWLCDVVNCGDVRCIVM